jgi:hypothetical protein
VAKDLIRPVSKPTTMPTIEPMNSPAESRHRLSRKSVSKVPVIIIPQRAMITLEGGGKSVGLTKLLRDTISHNIRTQKIGRINHFYVQKFLFFLLDTKRGFTVYSDLLSHINTKSSRIQIAYLFPQ